MVRPMFQPVVTGTTDFQARRKKGSDLEGRPTYLTTKVRGAIWLIQSARYGPQSQSAPTVITAGAARENLGRDDPHWQSPM